MAIFLVLLEIVDRKYFIKHVTLFPFSATIWLRPTNILFGKEEKNAKQ